MTDQTLETSAILRIEKSQDESLKAQVDQGKTLVSIVEQLKHINSTLDIHKSAQDKTEKHAQDALVRTSALDYRVSRLEDVNSKRDAKQALWEKPLISAIVKAGFILIILVIGINWDKLT